MNTSNLLAYFVCTIIVPMLISWWICPRIVKLAKEKNLTDCPGNRKLQKKPVPVVGGVCVFTALIISASLFYLVGVSTMAAEVVVAFALIFLIGFFDDMTDLSAGIKFVFQFLTIGLLYLVGYTIDGFNGLFGVYELPRWVSIGLSLFAGVGIMNAVNMIDGVNGLSSSVGITFSLISAVFLLIIGDWQNAAIALMFVGCLVPFFIANAFSMKYKMFIGDSGALMLGMLEYLLVCSLLHGVRGGGAGIETYEHSVTLVLAIFAMPVMDTLRVMTVRMCKGRSPFSADKTHLHHILLELKVPHLAVTTAILLLEMVIFGAWLMTNWWVRPAWLQLMIVGTVAIICSWGTYIYLARCRDKNDVRFQRMIFALAGVSRRIRTIRRRVEKLYDGYFDRKGFFVTDFDTERVDVTNIIEKLNNKNKRTQMEDIDYRAIDQEKILKYIASFTEVNVDDLIANAGAEKLRVYPILFDLEQDKIIIVKQRTVLGAPTVVAMATE